MANTVEKSLKGTKIIDHEYVKRLQASETTYAVPR